MSATADGGVEDLSAFGWHLVITKRFRPLSRLTATAPLSAGEPNALSKNVKLTTLLVKGNDVNLSIEHICLHQKASPAIRGASIKKQ